MNGQRKYLKKKVAFEVPLFRNTKRTCNLFFNFSF